MNKKEQIILLKIKSLLNRLEYIIKPEHKKLTNDFHELCRKYCSWGEK